MNNAPVTVSQSFDALLASVLATYPEQSRADYPAWFDGLCQRDRHLLVLQGLHSQVGSGGFAQWIENGSLGDLAQLKLALARMAASGYKTLVAPLQKLVTIVAESVSGNQGHLAFASTFAQLDDAYHAVSDAFEDALQRYFVDWV